MSNKWIEVLGKLAPTAATLLGGPFAGLAVGTVVSALGISDNDVAKHASPIEAVQEILTTQQLTGEQILALKKAEIDVKQHLADNNIKLADISAADRNSARQREMALKDDTPKILAYLLTFGFFGTLTFLMLGDIPKDSKDVLLIMVGSLGAAWTGMIAYYYGSSIGSKMKTHLLGG